MIGSHKVFASYIIPFAPDALPLMRLRHLAVPRNLNFMLDEGSFTAVFF
jgi:hypothetical protein